MSNKLQPAKGFLYYDGEDDVGDGTVLNFIEAFTDTVITGYTPVESANANAIDTIFNETIPAGKTLFIPPATEVNVESGTGVIYRR